MACLLRIPQALQGGDLQRQDRDDASHSRKLLGTLKKRGEQLQGLGIPLIGQVDAYQRQRCDFTAVGEALPKVGGMLGPLYRPCQVALSQPELNLETFNPGT